MKKNFRQVKIKRNKFNCMPNTIVDYIFRLNKQIYYENNIKNT